MKTKILFFMLIALSLLAVRGDLQTADSPDGYGVAVFDWDSDQGYSILPQAIIPTYVNPGEVINYKAELLRYRPLGSLGYPVKYRVEIRNEGGVIVDSYTVTIPQDVRQQTLSTSDVIFTASFTAPKQNGKYYYTGVVLAASGAPHTDFLKDEDTFRVEGDVPVACPVPSVAETVSPIPGGSLRTVTQTSYIGSGCTPDINTFYDASCDDGYQETGSGATERCEVQECKPAPVCPLWIDRPCLNGKKTRKCTDAHGCNKDYDEEIQCSDDGETDYIWVELEGESQKSQDCASYQSFACPEDNCMLVATKCIRPVGITESDLKDIIKTEDFDGMWESVCTRDSQCGSDATCTRDIRVRDFLDSKGGFTERFRDIIEWTVSAEKPNKYCKIKIDTEGGSLCTILEPLGEVLPWTADPCTDGGISIFLILIIILVLLSRVTKK